MDNAVDGDGPFIQRSRDFADAAAVIYETNEQIVEGPFHGTWLYTHILGHPP